jgi:peroxiredoxin (alkyl hydroperoxide reductase subunit C)
MEYPAVVYVVLYFIYSLSTVCPANWKPESPTIKPNPNESKEYFEKVN